jgi:hypothetical protein
VSKTAIEAAPAAASDAAIAEPTPPAPTTSARAPPTAQPLRRRPRTKPSPSNRSPTRRPSPSRRTALHAPAICTAGDPTSSRPAVLALCGMVISAPRMFSSVNTARRNAG